LKIKKKVIMNKNIDEKGETKVTKQEEYNQILELFGEKAEEIDLNEVQSIYIRKNPFTDNLKKVEEMTEEEKAKGLSRRRLREEAFKILFSMQFIKVDEQKVEIYCDINGIGNKEDIAYLVNIVDIYNENNKYLESIIEENKKDTWDYSRLDKIAITLIKLAIIEIEYLEIPFKISINECINICKKYNEEKNTKFINGILANYVKIKGLDNGI
jgi:transcription antitermination factor nusB